MITSGSGRYRVWLKTEQIGDDRLYILGGGEQPHIGGVVIWEPEKGGQTIILGTHKDHLVLEKLAEKACDKYKVTTVAVGGIHIENATQEEITIIMKNCKELIECI